MQPTQYTMYEILDMHKGERVGKLHATRKTASSRANKLDLAYGAVRYVVRPVQVANPI